MNYVHVICFRGPFACVALLQQGRCYRDAHHWCDVSMADAAAFGS